MILNVALEQVDRANHGEDVGSWTEPSDNTHCVVIAEHGDSAKTPIKKPRTMARLWIGFTVKRT